MPEERMQGVYSSFLDGEMHGHVVCLSLCYGHARSKQGMPAVKSLRTAVLVKKKKFIAIFACNVSCIV